MLDCFATIIGTFIVRYKGNRENLLYFAILGGALGPIERDKQTRLCSIGALSAVRCLIDLS